jgi:hypothetical protein
MNINLIKYSAVISAVFAAGAALYFVPKILKKRKEKIQQGSAENTTSEENPWSFNSFLNWSKVPSGTNILTYQQCLYKAKQIWNAMDAVFFEDEEIAVGVIVSLPSKIQVAQIAKTFFDNYDGRDLLDFLKEGKKAAVIASGLSDAQYNRVVQNVQRKPKY